MRGRKAAQIKGLDQYDFDKLAKTEGSPRERRRFLVFAHLQEGKTFTETAGVEIESVDIWFQDEARVGQRGTVTRTWANKGTRPRLARQQQFEYAYIFGAICPVRDEAVGLVMPAVNTEAMLVHLEYISMKIPEGRHAVIVLDRAAWHTTKRLKRFSNISLLPLPPVSPELNPTEQVWQTLRDEHLANRCYEDYDAITMACCDAWNAFVDTPTRVRRLCSRPWAIL